MAARQSSFRLFAALSIAVALAAGAANPAHAQVTWTNYTTGSGLGNNQVLGVYASGSTIYAATGFGGVSVSRNNGTTWTNYTTGTGIGVIVNGVYAQGSTIYAATAGGLSVSTDNGSNWNLYTTTTSGLASNTVRGVYASGSTIYAATELGLSVSTNNGTSWTTYINGLGLGSRVEGVYAQGSTIYAATQAGLSVSTNNGSNWNYYTTTSGLGSDTVRGVYASGSTIYAATFGGLSVSTNNGTSWTTYTTGSGLGSDRVNGVYASGSTIYAATQGGLSLSTNNGTNWTNYTTDTLSGLGNNNVRGVYAQGGTIYAATNGGLSVGPLPPPPPASITLDATSGTGTIVTNYTTASGSTSGLTLSNGFFAEYLAVGGGGSGGTPGGQSSNQNNWSTGGGGGGGMVSGTMQLSATNYAVTVGGGGAAPAYVSGTTSQGNNGANSVFGSFTAVGGGGGGGGENSFSGVGANGGSGGGGGSKYDNAGGTGTANQGNPGGAARNGNESTAGGRTAAGGGGGAGGVGGTPGANTSNGGNGGLGLASTITGSSVTYAGGGGGGAWDNFDSGETAGTGNGGGGAGSTSGTAAPGTDGRGGGGGGRGVDGVGGRGGAGIVIVRYAGASLGEIGGTVTSGSGSAAGSTLHTFTTTGTTTGTSAFNMSNVDMNARLGTTLTGTISGTGGLTFTGPGRLTLAANNTYTGDTRITSGTLAIGNANAVKNSTLDMNASDSGAITFSQASYIGGLTGSRAIANGGNTLTIGYLTNASTTYSGELSGTGGLYKAGSGVLTLSGFNTFTGDTRIGAGTLAISNENALAGSTLDMNGSGDGGTITFSQASNIGGLKGVRDVDNGGYTLTIGGNDQSTAWSGALSGSGGLIKTGGGTLTVSRYSPNFTGDTRIASGTLAIAPLGAAEFLVKSTLDMNASDSGAITFSANANIGGLKGSRDLANGGYKLTVGYNNQSTTYSGGLSGTGGLFKTGTGTLTLSGSNSFTGDTAGGTLVVANANALAGSTLDTTYGGYVTFSQASNLGGLKANGNLDNGGFTLTIGGNNQSTTYSGVLSGAGGLTKNGTGTLTLSGSSAFTGDTRITAGTLAVGNANALAGSTLDLNASDSGAITFSQASNIGGLKGSRGIDNGGNTLTIGGNNQSTTFSGHIVGSGGLVKTGAGTLTLSGESFVAPFTGDTRISAGTLAVASFSVVGLSTLDMNASDSGVITFNTGAYLGGLKGTRNVDIGSTGLAVGWNGNSTTYSGVLSGSGVLEKYGTGTLALTGNNTYAGRTGVGAGTLSIGDGGTSGSIASASVELSTGGTLVFNRSDASTYAGSITGTGSLTKLGAGTLTLTGSSSFTGNTTVAAGTLVLGSGNSLSSDLTVLSAATFDRAGYSQSFANAVVNGIVDDSAIGGLLTVTSMLSGTGVLNGDVLVTGVHAPGNSPGIQTFNGDLTYGNGADVNWELTSNTASNSSVVYDQIVLTGLADLTFSGSNLLWLSFNGTGSLVDWTNSFWDVNRAWTVFDLASGVTTGFGNLALGGSLLDANGLTLDASRGSFTLGQVGQDVVLNYTVAAVPEPSTMALALAGVAGYSLWRRRKQA